MATSSIATTKFTFGSILGSVSATAGAITSTINHAAGAVDMVGAYIDKAKKEQAKTHALELAELDSRLIEEFTMRKTLRDAETKKFREQSAWHDEAYKTNAEFFQNALNSVK